MVEDKAILQWQTSMMSNNYDLSISAFINYFERPLDPHFKVDAEYVFSGPRDTHLGLYTMYNYENLTQAGASYLSV